MNKYLRILRAAVICLTLSLTFVSKAQDRPDGTPLFTILGTNEWWDVNELPSGRLTSKLTAGGSTWSTVAFMHSSDRDGLWCGFRDIPYVATLTSDSPVKEAVGIVSAYLSIDRDYMDCLNSVTLRMSKDKDFTDYTDITIPNLTIGAAYWNFTIPEPAENRYYQLRIDFSANQKQNNWIELQHIDFYGADGENGTGSSCIIDMDDAEISSEMVEWYTLQGIRIEKPTKGIYIRKTTTQTTKIHL